jgi:hypothetical protein
VTRVCLLPGAPKRRGARTVRSPQPVRQSYTGACQPIWDNSGRVITWRPQPVAPRLRRWSLIGHGLVTTGPNQTARRTRKVPRLWPLTRINNHQPGPGTRVPAGVQVPLRALGFRWSAWRRGRLAIRSCCAHARALMPLAISCCAAARPGGGPGVPGEVTGHSGAHR